MPTEGLDKYATPGSRNVFAHMLRGEFVSKCQPLLISDAFSRFTRKLVDFDKVSYETAHRTQVKDLLKIKDVIKLTKSGEIRNGDAIALIAETPKSVADDDWMRKSLTITPFKVEKTSRNRVLSNIIQMKTILKNMHKSGLCYRHMGYVAKALLAEAESSDDPFGAIRMIKFCDLLAVEGAARTIKHLLWAELRGVRKDSPVVSPTRLRQAAHEFLNPYSRDVKLWGDLLIEIEKRFTCLPVNLTKLKLNWTTCLNRISELSGVVLSKRVLKAGIDTQSELALSDILAIIPRSSTVMDTLMEDLTDDEDEDLERGKEPLTDRRTSDQEEDSDT